MKHLYTFLFLVCILNTQAQDTTPPTTVNDLEVVHYIDNPDITDDELIISELWLNWTLPSDESNIISYNVYNYDVFFQEINCTNCDGYHLFSIENNSNYCLKITAIDTYGNESVLSNEVCLDTNIYRYNSEVFISQYYEDSNNKAIELTALPTIYEGTIDLSEYDLRINLDGGATWSAPLNLSGSISNDTAIANNTYVVCSNTSTNPDLLNNADLITPSQVLQFDGNDPIGLFKNGVLIDVFGNFNNGSTVFAENVNKVRDACFSFGASSNDFNGVYHEGYWIDYVYSCETLTESNNGIGHYIDCCLLSTKDITMETFKVHPNPIVHSELRITHTTSINISNIELYNINGKHIESFKMNYTNNQFLLNLPHLSKGVYFLKIYSDNKSVTKKLIKQ